jgi:hypothetical protein
VNGMNSRQKERASPLKVIVSPRRSSVAAV